MIRKLILLVFILMSFVACKNKDTEEWIKGASAPLVLSRRDSDIKLFAGFKNDEKIKNTLKLELVKIWGIKNKEDIEETIKSLLSADRRNVVFEETLKNLKTDNLKTDFKNYYKESGEKATIAWDYARAIHIVGTGYLAGYYSKTEAMDESLKISKLIQSNFNSWEEYNERFLEGFQNATNDYKAREILKNRIDNLQKLSSSPYRLRWDMILEKNW